MVNKEKFLKRLRDIGNFNVCVGDDYRGTKNKCTFKCLRCGHIWQTNPYKFFGKDKNGNYVSCCPVCNKKKQTKTNEEFISELGKVNKNILPLEKYSGANKKIRVRCMIDGFEWESTPHLLLSGKGCHLCNGGVKRTELDFCNELKQKKPDILLVGEYTKMTSKSKFRCLKCGCEWEATPESIVKNNTGCPRCRISHGEMAVERFLKKSKIKYFTQYRFSDCKNTKTLPFDFFLPQHNVCIEFDGEQHFHPVAFGGMSKQKSEECFKKIGQRDLIKTNFCKNKGINLIRISYKQIKDIDSILNFLIQ